MPRHAGASQFHDGALRARTRKARKARGKKRESQNALRRAQEVKQ